MKTNLMLSRRKGEAILIDGGIKVTVVALERGRVKLSVEAPHETVILREELLKEMRK